MNNVNLYQPPKPQYGYQYGPGVFNTDKAKAQSLGDNRYQTKQFDRAGMSRGGAQRQAAAERGGMEMAQGIAQAYGQRDATNTETNNYALQAQVGQEDLANQLARLNAAQRQGYMANQINLLSGLL